MRGTGRTVAGVALVAVVIVVVVAATTWFIDSSRVRTVVALTTSSSTSTTAAPATTISVPTFTPATAPKFIHQACLALIAARLEDATRFADAAAASDPIYDTFSRSVAYFYAFAAKGEEPPDPLFSNRSSVAGDVIRRLCRAELQRAGLSD